MRMILALAAAASVGALATPALAQDTFGTKNDFVFAAERLTGVYRYNEGDNHATVLGLLQAPSGLNVYQTARLGFDWFPIEHLSIGGSLSYWSYSIDNDKTPGDDNVKAHEFMFAPRIGYSIPITKSFGFWPRGGFSIRSTTQGDADAQTKVAISLEANFYASPAPHFAFIFGPLFDAEIAGDSPKANNIGILTGGILGWI
jgi:hypothetical protein